MGEKTKQRMGKKRSSAIEKDEKRERKRLKKEEKKRKSLEKNKLVAPKPIVVKSEKHDVHNTIDQQGGISILSKKKLQLIVSLLPSTLGRTQQCVEDSIRLLLLQYSESVGGIMLAYDNVKIIMDDDANDSNGIGWILNELPYIHYTVVCDALVFTPTVGCKVCFVAEQYILLRPTGW